MALTIGTQLGSHEITALLGKGGMGEVYRARDLKLKREVAIKILPEQFSCDSDRVSRFQREAEVLASLNHPNIASIYDLQESQGSRYLVLELVEGETLADRIAGGPIPIEEALGIAKEICGALEAAHERGIIHRDLKPANVKVTPDGKVKVLDFGLAKALDRAPVSSALSNSPTMLSASTDGMIIGTAAYMSPEQARGRAADKRSDVWAFGAVLFEMLTGMRAFEGDDVTETLASVLKGDPNWKALPGGLPQNVTILLKRCLTKDRQQRIADIAVAQFLLSEPSLVMPPGTMTRRGYTITAAGLLIGTAIIAAALWIGMRAGPVATRPVTRIAIGAPPGVSLQAGINRAAIALSPDGNRLVFVARAGTAEAQLFSRTVDQLAVVPLRGTELARSPFFSPDGQWIGFFSQDGKLKKVPVGGGGALTICESINGWGATWLPDDSIVFRPGSSTALWRVSAAGGTPQEFLKPDAKSEISFRWPEVLPGGKAMLFAIQRNNAGSPGSDAISVVRLDTKEHFVLIEGGTNPHYLSSGHVVFARGEELLALPFDVRSLRSKGNPAVVLEGVSNSSAAATASQFAASSEGSIAYVPSDSEVQGGAMLVWVDRHGSVKPLAAPKRPYQFPRLSPDGQQIAARIQDTTTDIWVYSIGRNTLSRLTTEANDAETPVWTPDGKRIAYAITGTTPARQIVWKMADGSGGEEVLAGSERHLHLGGWSPKGDALIAMATDVGNIWNLSMGDKKTLQPFLSEPAQLRAGTISPDGRWIAYASNETNRYEVYVQAFPNPGSKIQISTDGGGEPIWARSGRELFFRNGDRMMTVSIDVKGAQLEAGKPMALFEGRFAASTVSGSDAWYDVSPDGTRFLMLKAEDAQTSTNSIVIVQNWINELNRLAPAK
jgi:serine/threonine-protein kinase